MRRTPTTAALTSFVFQLAWAIWIGGLIVLGAVSAPGSFKTARAWPEPGSWEVVHRFAGIAAGEAFRRFNHVALACGVTLLIVGIAICPNNVSQPRVHAARLVLVASCLAITCWQTFVMFPEMDYYRLAGWWQVVDAFHHEYERWSIL